MITIEKLESFGADVASGLSRCMGNEEFYLKMVDMMIRENSIDQLKVAIEKGNLDEAFEAAHALKGVAANLSITPISEPAVEITEFLRSRTQMDYTDLLNQILQKRDELVHLAE